MKSSYIIISRNDGLGHQERAPTLELGCPPQCIVPSINTQLSNFALGKVHSLRGLVAWILKKIAKI